MTKPTVEFFFDFNSTYSYLANAKIAEVAAECDARIDYRPMSVVGVMQAAGNPPTPTCPAKFKYNWADAQRWAGDYGVTLVDNPHFRTTDTRPLGRMTLGAEAAGGVGSVRNALFCGFWGSGLNMGDRDVIRQVLKGEGIAADRVLAWADDETLDARLKANTEEAAERGAFGAPTFFVGDKMFFGNDRLDFVKRVLCNRRVHTQYPQTNTDR